MAENTFYKCGDCGVFFATLAAATAHKCPRNDNSTSGNVSPANTENTLFTCDDCGGWFVSKQHHDKHLCNTQRNASNETIPGSDRGTYIYAWDRASTLLLIDEYIKLNRCVESGTLRKKQMFSKIAITLKENGYQFNDEQVCGRWKTLVRGYKAVRDHNGKSGTNRKTHEYQNELDEIFQNDPCFGPNATLSSKRPLHEIELDQGTDQFEDNQELPASQSTSSSPSPGPSQSECTNSAKKKLRTKSPSAQVADMRQNYLTEPKERHEQETKRKETMHKDRMDTLKSLIEAIKGPGASNFSQTNAKK